jgi:predicted ATPase/DNA-binding winged helix-turn-helix (wHTH) protein
VRWNRSRHPAAPILREFVNVRRSDGHSTSGLDALDCIHPVDGLMSGFGHRTQDTDSRALARPTVADTIFFGPFRLRVAQRQIERNGSPVQLGSRAFDILVALIEQAGTVVSKDELMTRVWPGGGADESGLRVHVAALRKALGDGKAGARYLSTVSGQGYCFVAQILGSDDAKPSLSRPSRERGHRLPARPRQVVGREQIIEEISSKLTSHRFVTVVGPGGIGKTTVAVSIGHALLTEFAGEVYFLDLGAIRDAALVPTVVASALGLLAQSDDPSAALVASLRDKRLLLILDCCEHVMETSAALAERLYKEAPQLHLLATSRESLRVEGEHIHRLLALASPPDDTAITAAQALAFPAVQLFVERAAASSGQFELNDDDAAFVSQLCRRLDGIALAIELAASRVDAYGVKHTMELLNSQLTLLLEGRRTALPRHRTLSAAIDWSYNLLSESERAILCRLSVFFGNFTLEAARLVAAAEDPDDAMIMAALASLVGKSMLTLCTGSSSPRFRLLDTTRVYAQDKLAASADPDATARSHARYFLRLLEGVGDSSSDGLAAISDQSGNIRAALTWCFSERGDRAMGVALAAASMHFFFELSLLAECQLWATRALESIDGTTGNISHDIALHAALGSARMLAGQINDGAATHLTRALRLAETIGDVPSLLGLIDRLHLLHVLASNVDDALKFAKQGKAIAAGSGDFATLAYMRITLGITYHCAGDVAASRSCIEGTLLRPPGSGSIVHSGLTFDYPKRAEITLARILWLQGYPDQALETARQALAEVIAIDHPVKLCRALLWAFAVFYWNNEADNFEEHVDRVIMVSRRHALDFFQTIGQAVKGVVQAARGQTRDGLALLQDSVERLQRQQYGPQTDFGVQLAETLVAAGQCDEALVSIDRAIARAKHHNFVWEMPDMLRARGEVLISMKGADLAQAENCFRQSLDLAWRQGALGFELRSAVSFAKLRIRQGRHDEARGLISPVYARFTEGFNSSGLMAARELCAGMRRL